MAAKVDCNTKGDTYNDEQEALTIDQLVRLCAERDGGHVAVVESSTDGGEPCEYTSRQIDEYAHRAALIYSERYGLKPRNSSSQKPLVVAVSGSGDFEYLITVLALAKLGHATLFLSPRLSDAGCAELLKASNATLWLVQRSFQHLTKRLDYKSLGIIMGNTATSIEFHALPSTDDKIDTNLTSGLDVEFERNVPVWILHSSGSTGLPKLVSVPNGAALARYTANLDTFGLDTLTTVPLYHAFGMSSFFRSFVSHKTIQLYSKLPMSVHELLKAAETRIVGLFSAVPFTIKLLSESQEGIHFLRRFSIVTTGGSPMPEELGDDLVRQGVRLTSVYGSSETGTLLTSARPIEDNEWSWLRIPPDQGHLLQFEPQGPDSFELVCPKEWSMLADSNQQDGSWRTKDLFCKHPTLLGAFKYVGRLDDIIVLENGEKLNPISVENEISSSPLVDGCIIFGTGEAAAGVAVIPSSTAASIPKGELQAAIWLAINDAQISLPAYARLVPEMVLILSCASPIPRTDKGNIIRSKFLEMHQKDINGLYARQHSTVETVKLSEKDLHAFLSAQLANVLSLPSETQLNSNQSFSSFGIDSLQAIQLRNAIVRKVDLNGQTLGLNVAFDYPSIESLAQEIARVGSGGEVTDTHLVDEQEAAAMLERYTDFSNPATSVSSGQNIVLTGATGSLGAHLLAKLALSPTVGRVYCLVRASSHEAAQQRVEQSLKERRLRHKFPSQLPDKVICLASTLSDPSLGLGKHVFDMLSGEVDAVYHCGWTVNFNQRLRTFEQDCIAGVRHLIQLCLSAADSTPARFIFFSSIGTIMSTAENVIPERLPTSFSETKPTGYSRSKYVGEHICARAAAETGLPVAIIRIGQIVGDSAHGIWNTSEATPLMIRSVQAIGTLPALAERIRWLPVDHVAQIAIELGSYSMVTTFKAPVFNVVNPHTLRWTEDLLPLLARSGLAFQTIPPLDWLSKLESSDADARINPSIKLIDYFREQCRAQGIEEDREWDTSRAAEGSPTFRAVTAPSPELILTIVNYFKDAWNKQFG